MTVEGLLGHGVSAPCAVFQGCGVGVQVCQALLGWASDTSRLLDAAGARPLDLAMQADARRVIQLLNRL